MLLLPARGLERPPAPPRGFVGAGGPGGLPAWAPGGRVPPPFFFFVAYVFREKPDGAWRLRRWSLKAQGIVGSCHGALSGIGVCPSPCPTLALCGKVAIVFTHTISVQCCLGSGPQCLPLWEAGETVPRSPGWP